MANSLMDAEAIKQWILRRLGAPMWKVELPADHLEDAVEGARRWFSAKKGVKRQAYLPFYTGLPQYTLPEDVDVVLDVSFPVPVMDISLIFSPYILQDEKVPYDVFAAPSAAGIYSSYTQTLQYVATAKRILNAEPDWRQEGNNLLIFPVPKMTGQMLIDYKSHSLTIEQLSERDHDLVKRFALAWAKRDLGEIRTKYESMPGAQNSTTLNGPQLLAEADKEMEELQKEISLSAFPMGFAHG
jgi:hypothetical protein